VHRSSESGRGLNRERALLAVLDFFFFSLVREPSTAIARRISSASFSVAGFFIPPSIYD